jgi:multidrug efflux pump subunit AcrA (membrane-fusion protein)
MPNHAIIPWARRPELLITRETKSGRHVVSDPSTGDSYTLGEQEAFLLLRLDGQQTAEGISGAFQERFGQSLSPDDLQGFVQLAQSEGLLRPAPGPAPTPTLNTGPTAAPQSQLAQTAGQTPAPPPSQADLSGVGWRLRLLDPDRMLCWLAPKLWFFWTSAFLALSLGCIVAAAALVVVNWQGMAASFAHALRWQTLILVWLTLLLTTLCHEVARGLTCKHFGGKVHELGVTVWLLVPCFYCDTSNARHFREKTKRLWVTFAGCYCDLCVWASAVFAWRLTEPQSLLSYIAWVVLAILGIRIVFNFNPLITSDCYSLVSDLVEIPNLQQRASANVKSYLGRLLWGGHSLARDEKGSMLLTYGVACWLFAIAFVALIVVAVACLIGESWGVYGIIIALFLGVVVLQGHLRGMLGEGYSHWIFERHKHALLWAMAAVAGMAILVFGRMEAGASGNFRVRPVVRAELRAPVAGFLREVSFDEGSRVPRGALVLRFDVPNLANRQAEKQAEVGEAEARVRFLEGGQRSEAVAAERRQVEQAREWRDQAKHDLARFEQALAAELLWLEQEADREHLEIDYSAEMLMRYQQLYAQRAISKDDYDRAEKRLMVHQVRLGQANALRQARKALGVGGAAAELARRERALADAQASLAALEGAAEPPGIDAERARLARAREELSFMKELQKKTNTSSPVSGLITTPHLREKVGQYFREGELICTIEDPDVLEAEIALTDEEAARVQPGQMVELKLRARPAETFHTEVDRIEPQAGIGEKHNAVAVFCRLDNSSSDLRGGMIGEARIHCGSHPIGKTLVDNMLRWLRT